MLRILCVCLAVAITCSGMNVHTLLADDLDLQAIAELHLSEASAYSMFLDAGRKKPLDFQPEPIFKWQNLTNQGGQLGAIYVWTREGRPEVVGTMFSQREKNQRKVVHEFHTLAASVLTVDSPKGLDRNWVPKGSLPMKPLSKAPAVAETPVRRMTQMRSLAREFTGYTQGGTERIELRLAPQPLIRYQPTRSDVLDGAIFAFLSSAAGTDPEVMLVIEARKADEKAVETTWHLGIVRFTDRDLVVTRDDTELFSSIRNISQKATIEDGYKWTHNPDDTYYVFQAKMVPELLKPSETP